MRSNTFDPKLNMNKNPDKANSEKDFDTYSVQSKMSYQKQPQNANTTVSNNQKMTKSILQALKKLFKDNQKNIYTTGLKPTQKTLLGTISAFINSFDNAFDQSTLTIQMIPEIFKALGYPNTISKTYFQPVGAPHTWGQCLAMMEWLADLVTFHTEMRVFLEEQGSLQEDFTNILIKSFTENDFSIAKKYLESEIERKAKAIQGFKYNINTMNMEIENQKAAQKSLKEIDEEQKILEQILYRETQEAIQIQHQNTELEKKLRDFRNKVKEQEMLNQIHENEILSLTDEVQNQQLSVEQVQKIKYQIKETRQKITQLRKFEQREKQILDKTDETIINDYLEFNKTLEALRHMYRKHKYEMDTRNIYMDIPECDVTKFREFLKNRTQECTDVTVEEILGINQINDLKEKADRLLNLVDQEMRSLDETKQLISAENQKLNEQCLQKEMQNSEQQMKLSSMKSKMSGVQYEIQTVQMQINHLIASIKTFDNNIQRLHEEQNETLDAAQRLVQEVTEWGEISKTLKPVVDEAVEKMGMELIDLKVEIIEKVSEIAESMEEFNKDMGFEEFVKMRNEQKMKARSGGNQVEGNGEEDREEWNGEKEERKQGQGDEGIEVVRGDFRQNADQVHDYMSLFGQGAYQSPKPENVNRMLQKGYRP